MTDGYIVDPDALRSDANKYFAVWKDELLTMRDALPATMNSDDFSNIPGAQDLFTSFTGAVERLQSYLKTGSTELEGFATTLLESARDYMIAEGASEADIASVKQELSGL